MFSKILVANRGEIAVRAFRAAWELGIDSVAVFPWEDRNSVHRQKSTEAYQIGERGHPVRAYLDVESIVRTAVAAGADAVYPGYGFLSENPDLAQACVDAGITFIGPSAAVLEMAGNKATAVAAATAAGVPVLPSSAPSADVPTLIAAADELGFPVFVKAVAGGGGRGMRRVDTPDALVEALATAMREADSAFGDPTVFLERAVIDPRHIEVQILADHRAAQGDPAGTIHLFERDCSVQRRHQKVIEVAPAVGLDPGLRQRICADAVAFARHIGYVNAGTVEFLVEGDGADARYHFIEMNPRIQVEHTVTEEVTDVDLVGAQIRIAAGETLADLGLRQDEIRVNGAALQCRITTEDPANGFRPDTGKINTYRSPGGGGVRVDGGTVHSGADVSAHFDSLLVKLTCRGRDWSQAVARARRALAEFRIRGVATNIPFLMAVLEDPDFAAGGVTTSFIETHPELMTARHSADRGTRLLSYLADVTINRPYGRRPRGLIEPNLKLPAVDLSHPAPPGTRQALVDLGPEGFARRLREAPDLLVTDTTFRDAHQSLLATRVRTRDLAMIGPAVARLTPQLLSIEAWGGATYDVALRFLSEDPWERLATLREAIPTIALQMLLRGRNTVGYTPYPAAVTDAFVIRGGVDRYRHFPDLRRPQRRQPDAAGHRRGPGDRHRGGRGRPVLHRRPVQPGREALHPGLLPAAGRADRGRRRARAGDQGHGRAAARAGRAHPGHRAARAVRPAAAPAHPRHRRRAAGHPARRLRGRGGRGGRGQRVDGRHHLPAADVRAGRGHRFHRPADRAGPARGAGAGAVLGGGAGAVRAVRVGPAGADRAGLPARDPRRAAVQPAPAGDRARPGQPVRGGRGDLHRGQRHARPPGQGHPVVQGGRRPGPAPGRRAGRPGRVRGRSGPVRHPGLGHRVPVR